MRLFCVSDIHVDYKENLEWVERHASRVREEMGTIDHDDGQPYGSILLVAGDVCDDVDQFRKVRWMDGWMDGWFVRSFVRSNDTVR